MAVGLLFVAGIQVVGDLLEDPGTSESGASHHDGVDTVAQESLPCLFWRGDVAVSDNGDVDARIAFHLADERPVGLAGVHL